MRTKLKNVIKSFEDSRTIALGEDCPPTLILTLTLNQTLTLTGVGAIFLGGNCPDTLLRWHWIQNIEHIIIIIYYYLFI